MKKKKHFQKKKLGPAYIQIFFGLCLVLFVYLRLQGVHNLDEFKSFALKRPWLANALGIKKRDALLEAQKKSQGVLQKLNARDQIKKDATNLSLNFAKFYTQKEWSSLHDLIQTDISKEDFVEAQKLKEIYWRDPEMAANIREEIIKRSGLRLIKVEWIDENNLQAVFQKNSLLVKKALPKLDEIEGSATMDATQIETATGEILLEKLQNNAVEVESEEITLKTINQNGKWLFLYPNE